MLYTVKYDCKSTSFNIIGGTVDANKSSVLTEHYYVLLERG